MRNRRKVSSLGSAGPAPEGGFVDGILPFSVQLRDPTTQALIHRCTGVAQIVTRAPPRERQASAGCQE
jgi:hypothetical protein